MHPDERSFITKILADPADDTHRLVYADWLDENASQTECPTCKRPDDAVNHVTGHIFVGWGHGWQPCSNCGGTTKAPDGRHDRAEFIRVQCKLSQPFKCLDPSIGVRDSAGGLPCRSCRPRNKRDCLPWCQVCEKYDALRRREREIWATNYNQFVAEANHTLRLPLSMTVGRTISFFRRNREPGILLAWERGFVDEVRCTAATFVGGVYEPRITGIAGDLFAAHPITRVVLTDHPPARLGAGSCYVVPRGQNGHRLPADVGEALYLGQVPRAFDSEGDALAALSAALVAHGRREAGINFPDSS